MVPIDIRNKKTGKLETVPCGKCMKCRARRTSAWSFRLMQEEKVSTSAFFLTLTYDVDHVPITSAGYMSIEKKHLQKFFKRLRRAHDRNLCGVNEGERPLKYFAVGEYGGRGWRPHYHVIIFNAKLELLIGKLDADAVRRGDLVLDGKVPYKCASWTLGHITLGQVNEASVGYTLKYISKQSRVPQHRNDDRVPEFSLKSEFLGINYLSPEMIAWHKADINNRMYCNLEGGKKCTMPRYYKMKMYSEEEREVAGKVTREKMIEREEKAKLQVGAKYHRNRSEAHFAQMENAKANESKNQTF